LPDPFHSPIAKEELLYSSFLRYTSPAAPSSLNLSILQFHFAICAPKVFINYPSKKFVSILLSAYTKSSLSKKKDIKN
jgi:hypothetical protein